MERVVRADRDAGELARPGGGHWGRRPCSGVVRGRRSPYRPSPGGRGVPIAPTALRPAGDETLRGRRGEPAASSRRPVSPQVALTHGGSEPCGATLAAAGGEGTPAIKLHDYIAPGQRREAGLHPFGSGQTGSPAPPDGIPLLVAREPSAGRVRWQFVPARWQADRARWRFTPARWQVFGGSWQVSGAVGRFWRAGRLVFWAWQPVLAVGGRFSAPRASDRTDLTPGGWPRPSLLDRLA